MKVTNTIKKPSQPEPEMGETKAHEDSESKEYEKYEVEDAASTLTKAEEIKGNSKLHSMAMDCLKGKHEAMGRVVGGSKPKDLKELRAIASKKSAMVDENG